MYIENYPSYPAPMTYYLSIVTIGLSRTVSEINGNIRRKSHENRQFSHPVNLRVTSDDDRVDREGWMCNDVAKVMWTGRL